MRIKVDENLLAEVAQVLREIAADVDTVLDEGLGGTPDDQLSVVCQ